jgi:ribose transport system substrate-binding protein
MLNRRKTVFMTLAMVFTLSAAFAFAQGTKSYLVPSKPGPYVIGLSNSFSGNSWRAEMAASFKYAAQQMKDKGILKDYVVADATGSTANQIEQIQSLIARKVNAILIDANSATALNPVIEQAHNAGILVISFDNTVTSPYAIDVTVNQIDWGKLTAEWLVQKLDGKGNIIVLNGQAGSPVSNDRWDGAKAVFDKYPNIKILTEVNANWDQGTAQQAVANLLPSFPKIDGVWSQGGAMTLGAIYAFQAAGRPLVPMTGEANNGLLKFWKQNESKGFDTIAPASPTGLSVQALDIAVKGLQGQPVNRVYEPDPPVITSANLDNYVQMSMPDSLWLPTTLPAPELRKLFGVS